MTAKHKTLFKILNLKLVFLLMFSCLLSCDKTKPQNRIEPEYREYGFRGYVGYDAEPDPDYGMGVSFYTAAWPLIVKL